jgi:hypothetical protein
MKINKKERVVALLGTDSVMIVDKPYTANQLAFQVNLLISGGVSVTAREISHLLMNDKTLNVEIIKKENYCDIYVKRKTST